MGKVLDKTGLDGKYDFAFEFAGYMYAGGAYPPPLPNGVADTAPALLKRSNSNWACAWNGREQS